MRGATAGRAVIVGGARFVPKSYDRKLSPVHIEVLEGDAIVRSGTQTFARRPHAVKPFCASTSLSIAGTCPDSCPLKPGSSTGGGCYADAGMHRMFGKRLDASVGDRTPFEVVLEEVHLIDAAWPYGVPQDGARGGRDLRVHVQGEAPTRGAAMLIGEACGRYRRRGGGTPWTYTHAWREVRRNDWTPAISVLASVETPELAVTARFRGYAPAVLVDKFPDGKRAFSYGGTKVIPCPAESLGKTCVECRLCLDVDLRAKGLGIAFEAHGFGAEAARRALVPLRVRKAAG